MGCVKWFDEQSKLIKILLTIPMWGWAVCFVYKLMKFINDTSKTMTLVGAILDLFWVGSLIDFVLVIISGKLFLAD